MNRNETCVKHAGCLVEECEKLQYQQKQSPLIKKMVEFYEPSPIVNLNLGCEALDERKCDLEIEEVGDLDSDDDLPGSCEISINDDLEKGPVKNEQSPNPFREVYTSMRRFVCWPDEEKVKQSPDYFVPKDIFKKMGPLITELFYSENAETEDQPKHQKIQSSNHPQIQDQKIYKSKTTIVKIPEGVRIITEIMKSDNPSRNLLDDIVFNLEYAIYDSETRWKDKLIQVQLPKSNVLEELCAIM